MQKRSDCQRRKDREGRVWDMLPSEALKANAELDLDARPSLSTHLNTPFPTIRALLAAWSDAFAADKCALVLVV